MKEKYLDKRYHPRSMDMITTCNAIVDEFVGKGFQLTIRQMYYQLVARGHIENSVKSYDNVQALLNNARLAGLVDWDAFEDRTRDLINRAHWTGVPSILRSSAEWYHEDLWKDQQHLVIAIVEKEALAGIFENILHPWDIPLLPARGYASATALRELAKKRMLGTRRQIVVLHFGDHDPSGIDMTRDLQERFEMFTRHSIDIDFRRMALTMRQVEEVDPPPFPAKISDSRYQSYVDEYGEDSWELDALSPEYLRELIDDTVEQIIDLEQWDASERRIERRRDVLIRMANEYNSDDGTQFDPEEEEPDDE